MMKTVKNILKECVKGIELNAALMYGYRSK
ncbi:hypothetical protein IMSAGC004_03339 [Bacteroidaceae bacterium]|nr:hypothetical protein IMSAGC004_03339 [Bacteroidaceae bacterium]